MAHCTTWISVAHVCRNAALCCRDSQACRQKMQSGWHGFSASFTPTLLVSHQLAQQHRHLTQRSTPRLLARQHGHLTQRSTPRLLARQHSISPNGPSQMNEQVSPAPFLLLLLQPSWLIPHSGRQLPRRWQTSIWGQAFYPLIWKQLFPPPPPPPPL